MFDAIITKVISGEMSLKAALESVAQTKPSDKHILADLYLNKNVFIRTVTHHYTGKVRAVCDGFINLDYAAWIPDDGRFADCLAKGTPKEVEPYPSSACVAIGAIVDICEWTHELPRSQK